MTSIITVKSTRFGKLQVPERDAVEFPLGLVGLPGTRYALIEHNPGGSFRWLHSLEHPSLALPVVDPRRLFGDFALRIAAEDQERTGLLDLGGADVYVTVRASSDPAGATVNLRAPLLVLNGRGYQVINTAAGAQMRAPLVSPSVDRPPFESKAIREDAA